MLMITELQKYQAQFFQVSGFCLMTPLGKLVLDFLDFKLSDIDIKFIFYLLLTLLLTFFGIILVIHGMEILEERRQKWIQ